MNAPLVQRALWLAGITLIAALVALAITRRDAGSTLAPGFCEYRLTIPTPAKMISIATSSRRPKGSR